jgi:AcrR family transcriptional regulator
MGRPAARDARDTRRVILDAALDLFGDRGFHATSMRQLAAAVGVRESALYHHFASKEAILEALFAERIAQRTAFAEAHLANPGDRTLAELLTGIGQFLLGELESPRERKFMRMVTALGADGGEEHLPFHRGTAARKAIARLIGDLQKAGRIRRDVDPEVLMLHFAAPLAMSSGALWGGRRPLSMTMQRFMKQHIALLVRGAGK